MQVVTACCPLFVWLPEMWLEPTDGLLRKSGVWGLNGLRPLSASLGVPSNVWGDAFESVDGVAEVTPIGGFVKQYQIDLDPNKLAGYNISVGEIIDAVRKSNVDVGGKTLEFATTEFLVRGRGYIKNVGDLEEIVLKVENGAPIYLKNVAELHLGPDIRSGVGELNGQGEAVGGIVMMRYGANALNVIEGIKKKIEQISTSLPPGVCIVPTYDCSTLIYRAIDTPAKSFWRRASLWRSSAYCFSGTCVRPW